MNEFDPERDPYFRPHRGADPGAGVLTVIVTAALAAVGWLLSVIFESNE